MNTTPEVYAAHAAAPGLQPAVRMQRNGTVLALVTLSGYRIGADLSPPQWAERIAACLNYCSGLSLDHLRTCAPSDAPAMPTTIATEVHRTLVVSTTLLTPEDYARFDGEDDVPSCTRAFDYGWTVLVRDLDEPEPERRPLSAQYDRLIAFARERGCQWITFDSSGPHVEGFESHEH